MMFYRIIDLCGNRLLSFGNREIQIDESTVPFFWITFFVSLFYIIIGENKVFFFPETFLIAEINLFDKLIIN